MRPLWAFFFLKSKTHSFITSHWIRGNHRSLKYLQTLGGDLPIKRIDPGPKTNPCKLTHVHNCYKNVEHNTTQKNQTVYLKEI